LEERQRIGVVAAGKLLTARSIFAQAHGRGTGSAQSEIAGLGIGYLNFQIRHHGDHYRAGAAAGDGEVRCARALRHIRRERPRTRLGQRFGDNEDDGVVEGRGRATVGGPPPNVVQSLSVRVCEGKPVESAWAVPNALLIS
jgi:hypothetical protein